MSDKPDLQEIIFKQGILFDLDIGRWTATKKLNKNDLLLPTLNSEAIHLGHKKLIPKSALSKIKEIESKARATLSSCSSIFPISGSRFVRYPVLDALLTKLTTLKLAYLEEVKLFLENYSNAKTLQLNILNSQAEKIANSHLLALQYSEALDAETRKKELEVWLKLQYLKNEHLFPTNEELKYKFRFEWKMFKVTSADTLSSVSADQALEMHKKLQNDLQEWVKETATLVHKTLGQAAAHAKELLEKQGRLNPKNLKPLFDAFQAFNSVSPNLDGTSSIQDQINAIKDKYAFVSKDGEIDYEKTSYGINNSITSMDKLTDLLDSVGKYAIDDIALEAGTATLAKMTNYTRVMDTE